MKSILILFISLALFFSCSTNEEEKGRKYYIIIERITKSMISNVNERDDKKDSVLATSDENAYDSCIAILYGMKYADSVVNDILKTELEKADRMSEFDLRKQTLGWKVIGYKVINDVGVDIQESISDSIKTAIKSKWNLHRTYAK